MCVHMYVHVFMCVSVCAHVCLCMCVSHMKILLTKKGWFLYGLMSNLSKIKSRCSSHNGVELVQSSQPTYLEKHTCKACIWQMTPQSQHARTEWRDKDRTTKRSPRSLWTHVLLACCSGGHVPTEFQVLGPPAPSPPTTVSSVAGLLPGQRRRRKTGAPVSGIEGC